MYLNALTRYRKRLPNRRRELSDPHCRFRLASLAASRSSLDTLLIGSSRMLHEFDPAAIAAASKRAGCEIHAYNLGVGGMNGIEMRLLKPRTHRNLMLTMVLVGLWHGASWNFVIWGTLHGLALMVEREFSAWRQLGPGVILAVVAVALVHWLESRRMVSEALMALPRPTFYPVAGTCAGLVPAFIPLVYRPFIYFQF